MMRKPEHYPKWLREILFDDPLSHTRSLVNCEENLQFLEHMYNTHRTADGLNKLLFDLVIDHEREAIRTREEIKRLENRIEDLEHFKEL